MARRIVNTTYDVIDGFSYRLEVWDVNIVSQGGFSPFTEVEISDPGFVLDWKGSVDDVLQPIMSSSMKFSAYLTEAERTHITVPCFAGDEFRMFVRLYRQTSVQEDFEWAGIIHPEEVTEQIDDGRILTTFVASDGIASLKNVDYKDTNGDLFTGETSLVYWLKEVVQKLPHWSIINAELQGTATDGSHQYPLFTEHRLVRPGNTTHNHFPSNDAVLDHFFLKADSFYTRPAPREKRDIAFERKRTERRSGFVSTYEILHDICASLGATFCFSEGKFHLFDRERIINGDDDQIGYFEWTKDENGVFSHSSVYTSSGTDNDTDPQVVYLDHIGAQFLKGAARRGVYPVGSIAQVHEGAGSDLIFRSGMGYDGPNLETFLYRLDSISSGDFGVVTTQNVYSNVPTQGIITDINIPKGDDGGSFRLHFSGSAQYWTSGSNFENQNRGNLAVLRMTVRVNDGTNWYALRRRVRSLGFYSSGESYGVDVPNTSADYTPKTYEQYTWVDDADAMYDEAFLEIMIGADPSILTDEGAGTTDEFLQSEDFTFSFYTPPLLKQDADADNVLKKDHSRNHFIYRFDEQIEAPYTADGASSSFTKIQIGTALRLYEIPHNNDWNNLFDSSGNAIDVVSEATENQNFAASDWPLVTGVSAANTTSQYSENHSILKHFQLSGIEVYLGDGTENYDARYVTFDDSGNGSEQISLKSTAFGATFENSGNRAFGRYRATHPSDTSSPLSREDNIKMHPDGFTSSDMPFSSMYTSMGFYTTARAINVRGHARQMVTGTIIRPRLDASVQFLDVCRPYKKFNTSKLSAGNEEFLPHSITIQLKDHAQRVEALLCGYTSEATITEEQDDTGRDPNNPPGAGDGDFVPGGGVNHIFQKHEALNTTVSGISSKTDLITVTNSVDLDNISTGGSSLFGDLFPIFISKK